MYLVVLKLNKAWFYFDFLFKIISIQLHICTLNCFVFQHCLHKCSLRSLLVNRYLFVATFSNQHTCGRISGQRFYLDVLWPGPAGILQLKLQWDYNENSGVVCLSCNGNILGLLGCQLENQAMNPKTCLHNNSKCLCFLS